MEALFGGAVEAIQNLGVAGVSIVAVVMALVAFIKQFKDEAGDPFVHGNALLLAGFAIGFVSAELAYMYNVAPPVGGDWYAWFQWLFVGLVYGGLTGVLPSGVYELLIREKGLGIDRIEVHQYQGGLLDEPADE